MPNKKKRNSNYHFSHAVQWNTTIHTISVSCIGLAAKHKHKMHFNFRGTKRKTQTANGYSEMMFCKCLIRRIIPAKCERISLFCSNKVKRYCCILLFVTKIRAAASFVSHSFKLSPFQQIFLSMLSFTKSTRWSNSDAVIDAWIQKRNISASNSTHF